MRSDFPELEGLLAENPDPKSADCPDELEWVHLALGAGVEAIENRLLAHAAQCAACAVLLRRAVESAEVADDHELAPEPRQRDLVPVPIESSNSRPHPPRFLTARLPKLWVALAAAAVLLIAVSWLALRPSFARQKELIARSYQSGRPLPFRVSGVPWGPQTQDRGRSSARVLPLPSGASPEERLWAARACLWEGNYDSAISLLNAASSPSSDSAELLNDTAIAIAARGDRERAVRLLEQARLQYPDNTPILFNLATLLVQAGRTSQVELLLRELSRLEKDENWRRESSRLLP